MIRRHIHTICLAALTGVTALAAADTGLAGDDARKPEFAQSGGPNCNCPADIDGDSVVDVNDLLTVLGQWGGPGSGDVNNSGIVDVDDLLIVLGQWGGCTGLENDQCVDAIWLTDFTNASIPFCTIGATTDGPAHELCDAFNDDQVGSDIWFKFQSPITGTLDIETCGSSYDTKIAVYNQGIFGNTCPTGTFPAILRGCNDDSCGLQSRISINATATTTYIIRVGGYNGATGQGTLYVDLRPTGDEIEDCTEVDMTCGFGCYEEFTGNTDFNTGDGDDTSCAFNDVIDRWYCFTPNCNTIPLYVEVTTCHPETDFDTTLAMYTGVNGSIQLLCNDDTVAPECQLNGLNRKSRILIQDPVEGQAYYVRLSGYNGAIGSYKISFSMQCVPAD